MKTCFSKPVSLFARMFTVLATLLALTPIPAYAAGGIVYVVPGGTGDGSSWEKGEDLAAALSATTTVSGTQLWIQTGTYKPKVTDASHPENATFTINDGVELYGGFEGNESAIPAECTRISTLSGAVGTDAVTDNSRNVVTISGVNNASSLNCLTIQDGYASNNDGYTSLDYGGGIYNEGSPTLNRVTIQSNYADLYGGGMYTYGGSPTLTDVTFENNTCNAVNPTYTPPARGGGMAILGGSHATLTRVTFHNNTANGYGGGLYIESSSPALTGVTFKENTATSTIMSTYGGGLYVESGSPVLTNITFSSNQAISTSLDALGGGMANHNSSNTTMTNVIFTGNDAKKGGGLANFLNNSSVTLNQATFSGNHCTDGSNCGAGIYSYYGGNSTLHNSIVWGNENGQILNKSGTTYIAYSIVQGSGGSGSGWVASMGTDEGNNLDVDPNFVANVPYPDLSNTGNVHLQPGSPAINNGNNVYSSGVTTDRDGNARPVGGTVDMGAYEFQDTANLPPQTGIDTHPDALTKDTKPSFTFHSDPTGSTFQCKLDAFAWEACNTGAKNYTTDLSDGAHTFQVQATDANNHVDWTPASYTWSIDTTAETTIDNSSKPANPSKSSSVSFSFSCGETGCTFECKLGAAAWETCTSPKSYDSLADGSHTFQVRATDPLGNVDSSPDSYTWIIDLTPPITTIDSHPDDPAISLNARFTFSSNESGSTFQCRLDGGALAACASPKTYNNLVDGTHTFQVLATDKAGNPSSSPASFSWMVKVPPETTLQNKPASLTNSNSASFTFNSSEANSTFQCALDGGTPAACTSPQNYTGLTDGAHTFQVQATDPAGNTDPSPASYAWTIDTLSPDVSLDSHPENPSNSNRATFTFSSSKATAAFECKLNDYAWSACTSPLSYYPLANGAYTFQVQAKDAVGNASTVPTSYTWKIDQAPIVALPSGILSAGYDYTCAIKPDGSVDCWGNNDYGQSADQPGPYTQVSAGTFHTCALTPTGAVKCWGAQNTQDEQIDYGQAASQDGPYTQVSVGFYHTCALTPSGAVECWGIHDGSYDDHGQTANKSGPYIQVSAGFFHTCALKADGAVECWGDNDLSQAGNHPGPYLQVSAGYDHTCALKADGAVDCWGNNEYGQAVNQPGPYIQVSVGYTHTCGLTLSGAVTCWGDSYYGQVASQPGPYIEIGSGTEYSCGLTPTGAVDSWGEGATSQAGPYGLPETSLNVYKTFDPGARFEFSGSEANDTFECRLNGAAWEACTSPKVYTGLKGGEFTFQVRAVGATGIPDPTPSSFSWTVTDFWNYFPVIRK